MQDLHIGDFFRDSARMLVMLYRRFPTKSALYIEDIVGPDQPDEFGLHSRRYMAGFHTAIWLAEEGYYRFNQTIQQEALDEVVLSQKAMLHLSGIDATFTASLSAQQAIDAGNPIEPSVSMKTRIATIEAILAEKNSQKLNQYMQHVFTQFAQDG